MAVIRILDEHVPKKSMYAKGLKDKMTISGEVIYKTDICTVVFYGDVNMWGKSLGIYHTTDKHGHDDILIANRKFKYKCPKCSTKFDPRPTHRDNITCGKCGASYEFSGACHPEPVGDTRKEVEKVLGL